MHAGIRDCPPWPDGIATNTNDRPVTLS